MTRNLEGRQQVKDDPDLKRDAKQRRHRRTQRLEGCMNGIAIAFLIGIPLVAACMYLIVVFHQWQSGDYDALQSRAIELGTAVVGYMAAHLRRHGISDDLHS